MVNKSRPTGRIEDLRDKKDVPYGTDDGLFGFNQPKKKARDQIDHDAYDKDLLNKSGEERRLKVPEEESKDQDWNSSSQIPSRFGGNYGDGTFGGFMEGDDDGSGIQDYRRQVNKAVKGKTDLSIKADPALTSASLYMCSIKGCGDRLLIGVKNPDHIKYAIGSIRRLGWAFRERGKLFCCPEHKVIAQPLVRPYNLVISIRLSQEEAMIIIYNLGSHELRYYRWWWLHDNALDIFESCNVWMVPGTFDDEGRSIV